MNREDALKMIDLARLDPDAVAAGPTHSFIGASEEEIATAESLVKDGLEVDLFDIGLVPLRSSRRARICDSGLTSPTQGAVLLRLLGILNEVKPDSAELVVIVTNTPDYPALHICGDRALVLAIPTRRVTESPEEGFERIPGGWRKNNVIVPERPVLVSRERDSRVKFSAARREASKETLLNLFDDQWPDNNDIEAAIDLVSRHRQADHFRHSLARQLSARENPLTQNNNRLSNLRQRERRMLDELNRARRKIREIHQETEEAEKAEHELLLSVRASKAAFLASLGRQMEVSSHIRDLEHVEDVNIQIADSFKLKVNGAKNDIMFEIDFDSAEGYDVSVNHEEVESRLTRREIQISTKFGEGDLAEAVNLIIDQIP